MSSLGRLHPGPRRRSVSAQRAALRCTADKGNDKAALKEAAKQFESLFMRELIKSMREATSKSGLMDGEGSELGNDLLDQQLSVQLSGLPGAVCLRPSSVSSVARWAAPPSIQGRTGALQESTVPASTVSRASGGSRQAGFVSQHTRAAEVVARESGIPASYMIGQAGHETGWGKSEIRQP